MRLSQLCGKTLREAPADAETDSHRLLVRAGFIRPLIAGVYTYLPLGWRTVHKIEAIIREEMNAAGGQEITMPVLQPRDMWAQSGREAAFGPVLFHLRDRREHMLVLAPTAEEVVTALAAIEVRSYRDLPLRLYQIGVKCRDEARPRGGVIRLREFLMKDLYSFDADEAGLEVSLQKMIQAYQNIFRRCGVTVFMIEADPGAIGGTGSKEFAAPCAAGEDTMLRCPSGDYAANQETAELRKVPNPPQGDLLLPEEVATPGVKTIAALAQFLGIAESQTLKAVFYTAIYADRQEVVFGVIRGDLDVNEVKFKNRLGCLELRLATDEEVAEAGLVAGSASPLGLQGIKVVADDSITLGANFVAGANKPDTHVCHVNYPRDFRVDILGDIALARSGDLCPRCGQPLEAVRGVEMGHVFKLGTKYSEVFGATFLDKDGVPKPLVMGCYGIGLERLMAVAVEQNHDDKGIVWPPAIAPYQIHLCALGMDNPAVAQAAEQLYAELEAHGLEVLFDDRLESPGIKFNDADLIGLPLRLTVSARTLKVESVEARLRWQKEAVLLPRAEVLVQVQTLLQQAAAY
jgi:prolyl-tRNA synthetase